MSVPDGRRTASSSLYPVAALIDRPWLNCFSSDEILIIKSCYCNFCFVLHNLLRFLESHIVTRTYDLDASAVAASTIRPTDTSIYIQWSGERQASYIIMKWYSSMYLLTLSSLWVSAAVVVVDKMNTTSEGKRKATTNGKNKGGKRTAVIDDDYNVRNCV